MGSYEKQDINPLQEALSLWDEIVNLKCFKRQNFLLLLNDQDIFKEKIQRIPLTRCFPDYNGENTYESTTAFIIKQFEARVSRAKGHRVLAELVCNNDKKIVSIISNCVKDLDIRNHLEEFY